MAPPPRAHVYAKQGSVRGENESEALRVSRLLDRLGPEALALLPDSALPGDLEVWVQETPRLYTFPGEGTHDAEGLWSEAHGRILLARGADDLERTLAHELVHACLGSSWQALPGTLEEGLCDHVSTLLAPEGSARLRAGRLSSAALACGGLRLELHLRAPNSGRDWTARITLTGEAPDAAPQRELFRVQAGLSSTSLTSGVKRGYYGLAFLLIERVCAERGLDGLHALCERARAEGYEHVPRPWLLGAAGLDDDQNAWRAAAAASLGTAELVELVRMYPDFAADAIADYLCSAGLARLDQIEARLQVVEGTGALELTQLDFLAPLVAARL
jgi:hypothetical protein